MLNLAESCGAIIGFWNEDGGNEFPMNADVSYMVCVDEAGIIRRIRHHALYIRDAMYANAFSIDVIQREGDAPLEKCICGNVLKTSRQVREGPMFNCEVCHTQTGFLNGEDGFLTYPEHWGRLISVHPAIKFVVTREEDPNLDEPFVALKNSYIFLNSQKNMITRARVECIDIE